jgi:hypothetical protein
MSGFTKIKVGDVELEHYSTSSLIKMTLTTMEELKQGAKAEKVETVVWFEYSTFDDLIKAIGNFKELTKDNQNK